MSRAFAIATAMLATIGLLACGGGSDKSGPTATPEPRNPVLLVHGWAGHATQMEMMRTQIEALGTQAFAIELPGNDNVANAEAISTEVDRIMSETSAAKVDLVGYSMGGLSTRYYIKRLNGAANVGRYVSFGTPQYGGDIACVLDEPNGGQMCPGSAFLVDLNEGDDTPGDIPYTTIWSDQEVPASAGKLDGGACFVNVPGVGHADEPASPAIISAVLQALRGICAGETRSDPIT